MASSYDIVVVGGTPSGIVAAVRAARADKDTCLVTINSHLGGMMAGGLSFTDTMFGPELERTPLLGEYYERIRSYYRGTYGADSEQYETCNRGMFAEPHVVEQTFDAMVDEAGVTVMRRRYPTSVERDGRNIGSVTFESFESERPLKIDASAFVDATYEGELAAVAGAPYRIGRESRDKYDERFAGRVYTDAETVSAPRPGINGRGDNAVQAYNYRLCLSRDPDNRRLPEKPDNYEREEFLWVLYSPEEMREYIAEHDIEDGMSLGLEYRTNEALTDAMEQWMDSDGPPSVDNDDRWVPLAEDPYRYTDPLETEIAPLPCQDSLLLLSEDDWQGSFEYDDFEWGKLPNDKRDLNTCDLVGESDAYPEADWEEREEIARRHRQFVLGYLYFFQNDDAVPDSVQEKARQWGLAEDEFTDNDNFPFQLYVREARRIRGRETFTEHDAMLAEGLDRAPINETAVAIAEYPLDPHDIRPVRRTGTAAEGRFFLTELTVPSQIPYGTIIPREIDNLLVPVALGASHVGFQTIRLEPTWMQLGEAAGTAAVEALERDTTPADLDVSALQRRLVETGNMVSLFIDFDMGTDTPWVSAIQYLGTKGFFRGYEARPEEPLDETTAIRWARTTGDLLGGELDPTERARSVPSLPDAAGVSADDFATELGRVFDARNLTVDIAAAVDACDLGDTGPLSRGDACRIVYELTA